MKKNYDELVKEILENRMDWIEEELSDMHANEVGEEVIISEEKKQQLLAELRDYLDTKFDEFEETESSDASIEIEFDEEYLEELANSFTSQESEDEDLLSFINEHFSDEEMPEVLLDENDAKALDDDYVRELNEMLDEEIRLSKLDLDVPVEKDIYYPYEDSYISFTYNRDLEGNPKLEYEMYKSVKVVDLDIALRSAITASYNYLKKQGKAIEAEALIEELRGFINTFDLTK